MLELTAVDIHPPLYYLLLHVWIQLAGPGALAVRLLSVGIGTATVALLYAQAGGCGAPRQACWLPRCLPSRRFTSTTLKKCGCTGWLRCLAWLPLPSLGEEWIVGRVRWTVWWGYVLTATAALYTQYFAAFLLLGLNLVVFIRWFRARRPARALFPWLGAQLVTSSSICPGSGTLGISWPRTCVTRWASRRISRLAFSNTWAATWRRSTGGMPRERLPAGPGSACCLWSSWLCAWSCRRAGCGPCPSPQSAPQTRVLYSGQLPSWPSSCYVGLSST